MAPLRLLAFASALLGGVVSAESGDLSSDTKVWAAVAFVNHGERTPELANLTTVLTPVGAQQMWRQGTAFRTRYLADGPLLDAATAKAIGSATIEDIQAVAIENQELTILAQADEWVSSSAMAFLQGLYPPNTQAYSSEAGGQDMAHNWVEGSNTTDYPLDGYQYPNIQTLSTLDSMSPALDGTDGCTAWEREMNANLTQQPDMQNLADSTLGFYQELFSTAPLTGTVDVSTANFWYASELYEFVNYMYTHNETVHKGLKNATNTLALLQDYAIDLERAMNSDTTSSDQDTKNILYTIAGRTLAQSVVQAFIGNVGDGSVDSKLTLLFGSFRPLLSFFSLSGLLTAESIKSGPFSQIPEPGATMVFELVGEDTKDLDVLPSFDGLSVRFYYRATADDDEPFTAYSLFNSGSDGSSMPYSAFVREMEEFGRSSGEWCNICQPGFAVDWCSAYMNPDNGFSPGGGGVISGERGGSSTLSPVLAGLIGAVVMAAVLGLVALALYALLGFRVKRSPPKERNSSLGGFKGAEKMASDTDLAVTKAGKGHERVGSWELRNDAPVSTNAGIVTSDFRKDTDDDGISVLEASPVQAHEGV